MNDVWKINGDLAATLGITVAGGSFVTQGISYVLLDAAKDFDVAAAFAFGDSVILTRQGEADVAAVTYFQGTVAPISKMGDAAYEGHSYALEDAWADLERTTYQEEWNIGSGSYFLPRAVLGLDAAGEQLTVSEQISAIITYAASVGVAIQMGTVPTGEVLWPEEVANISCTECLNKCLQFHPDWQAWIDHSTTPPTFNVTAVAAAGVVTLATDGTSALLSFEETEREDLLPAAVRLVFEYATTIDDEVYRNAVIEKYPVDGPDAGPRVLCATIPLAGGQMQMQKSRVRVRPMPENGETSTLTKKWVKANYPQLKDVDLEDFEVTVFTSSLHAEDLTLAPHAPEINSRAARLVPSNASQVPNQLLEGQIEDWMRKKVGRVDFSCVVVAGEDATPEAVAAIAKGFPPGRVVCTNAVTKIYKGITQWAAAEDVPAGVAQAIYLSALAAYRYQGTAKITIAGLATTRYHGKKLTLTGAGTTNAPIHSVTWDAESDDVTLGFGPVPELAPADFLELQRRVRTRPVRWWSSDERSSNKLGAQDNPSAAGDSVGGYHGAEIIFEPNGGSGSSGGSFCRVIDIPGGKALSGGVVYAGDKNFNVEAQELNLETDGVWLVQMKCEGVKANRDDAGEIFLPGIETATSDPVWDNKAWTEGTNYDDNTEPDVSDGLGTIYVPLGNLTIDDGVASFSALTCGDITLTQCAGILGHTRG